MDVSQFTALSEQLSKQGPSGNAVLSETLHHLYAEVTHAAGIDGGSVMFFAGDGALCFWQANSEADLPHCALAAVDAALRLMAAIRRRLFGGVQLRARHVVLSGAFALDTVGGTNGDWLDILTGEPLELLASHARRCPVERVLLSAQTVAALGASARVRRVAPGAFLLRGMDREAVTLPRLSDVRELVQPVRVRVRGRALALRSQQLSPLDHTPPELRRVSVVFLQWDFRLARKQERLQTLVTITQRVVADSGGGLCSFVEADKGLEALVVFGLPGHSSGEDPARAVRFAWDVCGQLAPAGLRPRTGVATGPAFCGPIAGRYCVVGKTVIRSARLADVAATTPLVDDDTAAESMRRASFSHHGVLRLKGLQRPLTVHRIGGPRRSPSQPAKLVDRLSERAQLRAMLDDFRRGRAARLVLIQGELGVGKSALCASILALARELQLPIGVGMADALEQRSAYHALSSLLRAWFGEVGQLRDWIAEIDPGGELAPLLNPLLATQFEHGPLVQQMAPEIRAENRHALLLALLERQLGGRRVVFTIDDAHWMDVSSYELMRYLRRHLPNVLWILCGRAFAPEAPGAPDEVVRLAPLAPSQLAQLLASELDVAHVAAPFVQRVIQVTQGNPLHSLELCRALVSAQRIELSGDTAGLAEGAATALEIPGTLEALIQSRFDRLSSVARRTLLAASVLGQSFDLRLLARVAPVDVSALRLTGALEQAVDAALLQPTATGYEFQHASVHAVIYGLLPPNELRDLHGRTARALQGSPGRAEAAAARLAHHWMRAGDAGAAAECSAVAARQALESYANADAVHLYQQALEQDHVLRGELAIDLRRAKWSTELAQALYSSSRHAQARAAYARALSWCGFSLASDPRTLSIPVAVQAVRALIRPSEPALSGPARQLHLAALQAIHGWAALGMWEGRLVEVASRAFVAYRLAQRVADSAVAAEIISGFGYLFATTPARSFARGELQRGVELADQAADVQAMTSARVLLGMFLTMTGSAQEAEQVLLVAEGLADRLGSGLWRHRACFGLAEAQFFGAAFERAEATFAKAARIAADAEPPVEGFANSLCALAAARRGQLVRAYELVSGERGVGLTDGGAALQRFVALGICAEISMRCGAHAHALEQARQACALAREQRGVNAFFAALHGHAGALFVFDRALGLRRRGVRVPGWDDVQLRRAQRQSLRRLTWFAGMYPASRACIELLRGERSQLRAQPTRALRHYQRAAALAAIDRQPYYRMLALHRMAACAGARPGGALQREAQALCEQHGMVPASPIDGRP